MNAYITACGTGLPDRIVTNAELAPMLGVSPDWIEANSGIKQRRWADAEVSASDLAASAVMDTIDTSAVEAGQIDYLIGCTISPDYQVPGIAPLVQAKLAMIRAVPSLDIRVGCCGMLYCLQLSRALVYSGTAQSIVCFGAEAQSKGLPLDAGHAETSMLFGDGAGAFLVQPEPGAGGLNLRIDDVAVFTDGAFADDLCVRAPGSGNGRAWLDPQQLALGMHLPHMQGKNVILHAVRKLEDAARQILARNDLASDKIDLVIPHQANVNMLKVIAKRLEFPLDRMVINLDHLGNTSSASAFIALCQAKIDARLGPGDRVLFLAFGAGFIWGSALCTVIM